MQYDERYSPTQPGFYTWPLKEETGYYKTLYAGPLPPLECSSSVPSGTTYKGCFADSSSARLFKSDSIKRPDQGTGGMTTQVITRRLGLGRSTFRVASDSNSVVPVRSRAKNRMPW